MPLNGFNTQLSWTDYRRLRKRPYGIEDKDAQTVANYSADKKMMKGKAVWIISSLTVDIFLERKDCWVLDSAIQDGDRAAALLCHEQGYYDLMALGAREFFHRAILLTATSKKDLTALFRRLAIEINIKIRDASLLYDNQTNHGLALATQDSWLSSIYTAKSQPEGTIDDLPSA